MRLHRGELSVLRLDDGLSIMLTFPLNDQDLDKESNRGAAAVSIVEMENSGLKGIRSINKIVPYSVGAPGSTEDSKHTRNFVDRENKESKAPNDLKPETQNCIPPANLINGRVLVVDDSAMIRKMIIKLMTSLGHTCDEADDGDTAIKIFRSKPSFDLILMDNQMPRLNGQDAARIIRDELRFQGIIIGVTGNVLPEEIQTFIERGADDVIIKPMTSKSFLETVDRVLKKRQLKICTDSGI